MQHGKIEVDIQEDYPGCQHYHVKIKLPGYGNRPGDGEFVLVPVNEIKEYEDFVKPALFRPEYAKAIKRGLENV